MSIPSGLYSIANVDIKQFVHGGAPGEQLALALGPTLWEIKHTGPNLDGYPPGGYTSEGYPPEENPPEEIVQNLYTIRQPGKPIGGEYASVHGGHGGISIPVILSNKIVIWEIRRVNPAEPRVYQIRLPRTSLVWEGTHEKKVALSNKIDKSSLWELTQVLD